MPPVQAKEGSEGSAGGAAGLESDEEVLLEQLHEEVRLGAGHGPGELEPAGFASLLQRAGLRASSPAPLRLQAEQAGIETAPVETGQLA